MQLTDDEEALKEEEEEALRLQREAANALQPEDFGGDSGGDSEVEEAGERAEPTLGQRAQQVHCSHTWDGGRRMVAKFWPAEQSRGTGPKFPVCCRGTCSAEQNQKGAVLDSP